MMYLPLCGSWHNAYQDIVFAMSQNFDFETTKHLQPPLYFDWIIKK